MSTTRVRFTNSRSQERPVSKYVKGINTIQTDFSQKTDEIFYRIKVNTFVTVVLQHAQIQLEEDLVIKAVEEQNRLQQGNEDVSDLKSNPIDLLLEKNGIKTTERATFQSVIMGVGENDFRTESQREDAKVVLATQKPIDIGVPYLLLDVRPEDDYRICHMTTAISYPYHLLSRAFNYEIREMLAFKNLPGRMIIIYDENEKNSPRVASTLIQRGYDNVYLLSGGLKAVCQRYPNGLITGKVPAEILQLSPKAQRGRPAQSAQHGLQRSTSTPSLAGRRRQSVSNKTTISSPFTEDGQMKLTFVQTDLEVLRSQLEYNLAPRIDKSRLVKPRNDSVIAKAEAQKHKQPTGPKKVHGIKYIFTDN